MNRLVRTPQHACHATPCLEDKASIDTPEDFVYVGIVNHIALRITLVGSDGSSLGNHFLIEERGDGVADEIVVLVDFLVLVNMESMRFPREAVELAAESQLTCLLVDLHRAEHLVEEALAHVSLDVLEGAPVIVWHQLVGVPVEGDDVGVAVLEDVDIVNGAPHVGNGTYAEGVAQGVARGLDVSQVGRTLGLDESCLLAVGGERAAVVAHEGKVECRDASRAGAGNVEFVGIDAQGVGLRHQETHSSVSILQRHISGTLDVVFRRQEADAVVDACADVSQRGEI